MLIRFRKSRLGPEMDLVNKFLDNCHEIFAVKDLEVTVLVEAFAEVGIPDILIIVWDKNQHEHWREERNSLQKNDLKVVHFISSFEKQGIAFEEISKILCYKSSHLRKIIDNLLKADLIEEKENLIKIKNFTKNFFIREIISVEAKINDWKKAIGQAQLNQNFSSHSYLLLPEEKVNESVLAACSNNTGLLIHDGEKSSVKCKATKSDIPGSYFSWMLNEYIGQQHFAQCTPVSLPM